MSSNSQKQSEEYKIHLDQQIRNYAMQKNYNRFKRGIALRNPDNFVRS
jgi:hypothetical protein